jgi:NAD(P)-dependent dehydrogenase (short-subunit alcohol dehydrogenase family)
MTTTEKIAFITGANRGLGLETARELGKAGVTVILGSRDLAKGEAAADQLQSASSTPDVPQFFALRFDIDNPADHQQAFEFFSSRYGRLDILVNNAAIWRDTERSSDSPRLNNVAIIAPSILREVFETNFFRTVELTQTLLPLIRKSPAGRIVNLSSILASLTLHADPSSPIYESKAFAYNASKSALNAFTVHLAHLLRNTNIKVNSAHPGWVKTEMGGPHATMELSEGGKTSAQLALLPDDGPTGSFIHLGQTLPW